MQQAFDYIVKARQGSQEATVRFWRSFKSANVTEQAYAQIAKFIFELSRGLGVGKFDQDWLVDGAVFVDTERAATAIPSVESYRVLEATGKEQLLAISQGIPDSTLRRWIVQEADLLDP